MGQAISRQRTPRLRIEKASVNADIVIPQTIQRVVLRVHRPNDFIDSEGHFDRKAGREKSEMTLFEVDLRVRRRFAPGPTR